MASLSRRSLLKNAGLATVGGAVLQSLPVPAAAAASLTSYSMAMHIHATFSEGSGSMEAQLSEAARNGVDVLFWTEHDWRMAAYTYRDANHFTAASEAEDGLTWVWQRSVSGSAAHTGGGFVTSPCSPRDSGPAGALALSVRGAGADPCTLTWTADDTPARKNLRTTLAGLTIQIDVLPQQTGDDGWLELVLGSSTRPAHHGNPAGTYQLIYRIGGPDAVGTRRADGTDGIVTVAAGHGTWSTLTLHPADDLAACFPGVDGRDAAGRALALSAVSTGGATAAGVFDNLRLNRSLDGQQPLALQRKLMALYAGRFPVRQYQALELSWFSPHVNWFGRDIELPDYTGADDPMAWTRRQIGVLHARGGLASYNHMYGTGSSDEKLSAASQDKLRQRVTGSLVRTRALGADLIEVGYVYRGGVSYAGHVAAWDTLSRNGMYLTGTGVSDDHSGLDWIDQVNRFVTHAWASSPAMDDLTAAMAAGRCYYARLGDLGGVFDLTVDGAAPMGSVARTGVDDHTVTITATGLPASSVVRLVAGPVDYAGADVTEPGSTVVAEVERSRFQAAGAVDVPLSRTASCYLRAEVVAADGTVVAGTNPVWLLRERARTAVPACRVAVLPA